MPDFVQDDVFQGAALMSVNVGLPGNSKRVDQDTVSGTVVDKDNPEMCDAELLGVSKRLMDSEELAAVRAVVTSMKKYIGRKCIVAKAKGREKPTLRTFLKAGIYIVPYGLITEVDAQMQVFKTEFFGAVEAFMRVYPDLVESAKDKLRALYNAADYPAPEDMKNAFYLNFSYLNVSTPKALENISAEIFKREQEEAKKQWSEASNEVRQVLRLGMQELVQWMLDVCRPPEEGKRKKKFHEESAEKLIEFCNDFAKKDLTSDAELSAVVNQVKDVLAGMDASALSQASKSSSWRDGMAAKFGEIKETLDTLVVESPERQVSFA